VEFNAISDTNFSVKILNWCKTS